MGILREVNLWFPLKFKENINLLLKNLCILISAEVMIDTALEVLFNLEYDLAY